MDDGLWNRNAVADAEANEDLDDLYLYARNIVDPFEGGQLHGRDLGLDDYEGSLLPRQPYKPKPTQTHGASSEKDPKQSGRFSPSSAVANLKKNFRGFMPKPSTGREDRVLIPKASLSPLTDNKLTKRPSTPKSSSRDKDITFKAKTPLKLSKDMTEMPKPERPKVDPSSLHKDMVMLPKEQSKLPKGGSNHMASHQDAPNIPSPVKNMIANKLIPVSLRKNVLEMINAGGSQKQSPSASDADALVRRAEDFQFLQPREAGDWSEFSSNGRREVGEEPQFPFTRRNMLAQTMRLLSGNLQEPKKSRRNLIRRAGPSGRTGGNTRGQQRGSSLQQSKSDMGPLTGKSKVVPRPSAPSQHSKSAPNPSTAGSKKESALPGPPAPIHRMPSHEYKYTLSEGDSPRSAGSRSSSSGTHSPMSNPFDYFSPGYVSGMSPPPSPRGR